MPYDKEHSCRLIEPSTLKGGKVFTKTNSDGSKLITFYWGSVRKPTKVKTQAKRYPVGKFSLEQARKDCKRLGGKFEPAKSGT